MLASSRCPQLFKFLYFHNEMMNDWEKNTHTNIRNKNRRFSKYSTTIKEKKTLKKFHKLNYCTFTFKQSKCKNDLK